MTLSAIFDGISKTEELIERSGCPPVDTGLIHSSPVTLQLPPF
jgi:hypothetical protein